MEVASSDANVCIPQTSSPIMMLVTHTGLRGVLKVAHLLCPCSDLHVPVPCRGPAYHSPKQRVKQQLLCLAQNKARKICVCSTKTLLLSRLLSSGSWNGTQTRSSRFNSACGLSMISADCPAALPLLQEPVARLLQAICRPCVHLSMDQIPASWMWWSCCPGRSHIFAIFYCSKMHLLYQAVRRRWSCNVPLSPVPLCALPTLGESQLFPVLLWMMGTQSLLHLQRG